MCFLILTTTDLRYTLKGIQDKVQDEALGALGKQAKGPLDS